MTLFTDATKMWCKTLSCYDNLISYNIIIFSQELSATHFKKRGTKDACPSVKLQ